MSGNTDKNWTDTDKAQWILENGEPEIVWIFERNGEELYKRPVSQGNLPPWISKERQPYANLDKSTGYFKQDI